MGGQGAKELRIAALAGRQHGVVSRAQLSVLGFSNREIERRVSGGRLHPVHRGVYAVGHRVLTTEGRWMAATLATGGVLSHATAAAAWDLSPTNSGLVHVTVAGDGGRKTRAGVRIHRSATVEPRDTTTRHNVPVTTPIRTVLDLAASSLRGREHGDPKRAGGGAPAAVR